MNTLKCLKERNNELIIAEISDYQFLINRMYRDKIPVFFEDLNSCFEIIKKSVREGGYNNQRKEYLIKFVFENFPKNAKYRDSEVFKQLGITEENELFQGNTYDITKRLLKLINPYFMSGRIYGKEIDLSYRKKEIYQKGDSIILEIRLLSNFELMSNRLEFIEQTGIKVKEPYLGECETVIDMDKYGNKFVEKSTLFYDPVIGDTLTKVVYLNIE